MQWALAGMRRPCQNWALMSRGPRQHLILSLMSEWRSPPLRIWCLRGRSQAMQQRNPHDAHGVHSRAATLDNPWISDALEVEVERCDRGAPHDTCRARSRAATPETPVSRMPGATASTSPTVVAHGSKPRRRLLVEESATEEPPKKQQVEGTLPAQASTSQQRESAGGPLDLHPTTEDFPEPRHSRPWMVGQAGCRGAAAHVGPWCGRPLQLPWGGWCPAAVCSCHRGIDLGRASQNSAATGHANSAGEIGGATGPHASTPCQLPTTPRSQPRLRTRPPHPRGP